MDLVTNGLAGLASIALAYTVVLTVVRLAGRRTVSQMSAFDVVITIALGSLLAQTSTSGTGLVRGLVAISGLVGLQTVIGWARRRSPRLAKWVDFAPRVVVDGGQIQRRALGGGVDGPQMTEGELLSHLRASGVEELDDVRFAVLESTGGVSVLIRRDATTGASVPGLWRDASPDGVVDR
ncbi:MAG TPA: YetF domain-containing protein [Actinomycetota bacterium]|nr:YetF domain-containing protein [Actinomycetota bacterium]